MRQDRLIQVLNQVNALIKNNAILANAKLIAKAVVVNGIQHLIDKTKSYAVQFEAILAFTVT